jgi:hypothetical protein
MLSRPRGQDVIPPHWHQLKGELKNVRVPQYDSTNLTHQWLAELSRRAHEVVGDLSTDVKTDKRIQSSGDIRLSDSPSVDRRAALERELAEIELQVDQAAAELWGITAEELAEIRRSLEELRG